MVPFYTPALKITLLACLLQVPFAIAQGTPSDDDVLQSAIDKGKLAASYWVNSSGKNPSTTNYYADICSYYGACLFGDAQDDNTYYTKINNSYNRTQAISTANIDECSCGILPLHLFLHNDKQQQLQLGLAAADANMQKNGFVRNAIDDTYMTGSLHIQAFKATDDKKYLNFFADYMTMYQGNLQQSNGLYWHHKDLSHQFWGRGNGWGAASSAELLRVLPEDHEKYDTFIDHYKKHMKGLIDAQLQSGMWPQLLKSTDSRNWEESSGTSMFVFALFTGLELGVLDTATYLAPAKKGWMAVKDHLGSDGKLKDIAAGFWPSVGDANEYLNANRAENGNSHGTAGFLWAATAVIRYYNHLTAISNKPTQVDYSKLTIASPQKVHYFDLIGRSHPSFVQQRIQPSTAGIIVRRSSTVSQSIVQIP
ncbi:MAG: glycoside hydrolase family 88 protein [Chitinispirillaceae bacterium]|nr:glycoside hydrolase family 88 protein [Chitinispirillaceae bacterium]